MSYFKGSEENIPSEILIILWASLANTVPALFWVIYHLLNNPAALGDVMEEIKNVIVGGNDNNDVTPVGVLENMVVLGRMNKVVIFNTITLQSKYLESCIMESLRIAGSAMAVRKVTKATKVKTHAKNRTYLLRKGDYTSVFTPIANMNPELYQSPNVRQPK